MHLRQKLILVKIQAASEGVQSGKIRIQLRHHLPKQQRLFSARCLGFGNCGSQLAILAILGENRKVERHAHRKQIRSLSPHGITVSVSIFGVESPCWFIPLPSKVHPRLPGRNYPVNRQDSGVAL